VVGDGVRIGANAVIDAGLCVGAGARIKPGAVVLADVPAGAVVAGNPALVIGHADDALVLGCQP
jgi:acetyltransferase-like isoleucine patch superfamily enzyme